MSRAGVIGLAMPGGPDFVDVLRNEWEAGNAVAPIDDRLSGPELERVIETLQPTAIIDAAGTRTVRPEGRGTEVGDALVVATSGSTGLPKAVVLTHAAVKASAELTTARLDIDADTDRWLCCLPVCHVGGLSVVTRALHTQTALTIHPRFDAAEVMRSVRELGVTRVSLVTRALAQVDPGAFTTVLLGGAAPPKHRPPNVIATYGSTETGSGVVYERHALDGVELQTDQDGQLWVRSPTLLRCYRDGSDPKDEAGWYPTGDAATIVDGVLSVSGRMADVIVTGGEKVWPARIEPLIRALPEVRDVVVTARAHPEWGHQVHAVIEPEPGSAPPGLDDLKRVVRAELPDWWSPRSCEVVSSLPRTGLGKVKRSEV